MSQKRSSHTERLLKGLSKKVARPQGQKTAPGSDAISNLREQYHVIREDIMKLRDDLQKGYDMAKGAVEKKSLIGQLFKSR